MDDAHSKVGVVVGHGEEKDELERRGDRARGASLDGEADEATNHEVARLERARASFRAVKLVEERGT